MLGRDGEAQLSIAKPRAAGVSHIRKTNESLLLLSSPCTASSGDEV